MFPADLTMPFSKSGGCGEIMTEVEVCEVWRLCSVDTITCLVNGMRMLRRTSSGFTKVLR